MKKINLKAMAKINLGLDVLRKREDGYHEVRMIMQTIRLYDAISIATTGKRGIYIKTNLPYLPVNQNNLVYQAARMLADEFQIKSGLSIHLRKNIPVAAGLAGGSSDAAAVLFGMNKMFGLGLSKKQLMERGLSIGADVPYCIMRGTALAEGIGEALTSLRPMVRCSVLVAKPGIRVSTKMVYGNLTLDENIVHPDIDAMVEAIRERELRKIASLMGNVLETVTIPRYPVIEALKEEMKALGALNAMMSGSGPTVFGLFDDKNAAKAAFWKIKEGGLARHVFLTETL